MEIIYENKKYIFEDKWLNENGKEIKEIFSNYLCDKAIKEGADPSIFEKVKTSTISKITKPSSLKKKEKKKAKMTVLFDFGN